MNTEPVAHIVFIHGFPRSMMGVSHAIEVDGYMVHSTPVYESIQKDWFTITEAQFKVLAKQFGYVKGKK